MISELSAKYWVQCLTSQAMPDDPTRAALRTILRWRWRAYLGHFVATAMWHLKSRAHLNGESAKVVESLRRDGVAVTTVDALGLDRDLTQGWKSEWNGLADLPAALERGRDRHDDVSGVRKDYFYRLLGHEILQVDYPDTFSRVALDPTILEIANAYLRTYARLTRYNVWLNLPS